MKVKKESNKDENDDTDEEEENVTIKNAGDQDEFNFENYDDECKWNCFFLTTKTLFTFN